MNQDPSNDPRDPQYAIDDRDNRRRQAFVAVLVEHYYQLASYLAQHPDDDSVVLMAHQLIDHLRESLNGPLDDELDVSCWWTLQQGSCEQLIVYLKRKARALDLLTPMFASLTRLGLSVRHEPKRL
jgi:hypothetical protein